MMDSANHWKSLWKHTRRTIWQVSERAAIAGVLPGQQVSQAISLCPALTLLEPDPSHYDTDRLIYVESVEVCAIKN